MPKITTKVIDETKIAVTTESDKPAPVTIVKSKSQLESGIAFRTKQIQTLTAQNLVDQAQVDELIKYAQDNPAPVPAEEVTP